MKESNRGMTLIEILAAMIVGGVALTAFMRSVKPTISSNQANRKQIDITGALAEVLDSTMTLPVATLDGMDGQVYKSRQGVSVRLAVQTMTQGEADAILTGMDISRLRKLTVRAQNDTTRTLSATVSNYLDPANGKCYDE